MHLHDTILYSFFVAGHSKFGPDCCFGIIKKSYKVTQVLSLFELARMVENYSSVGINKTQLVGTQDGRIIVSVYDWVSFLEMYFKKIPSDPQDSPGVVFCKEFVNRPEQSFVLLKDRAIIPPSSILPSVFSSDGISQERKNFLYQEIQQFCKPGTEDLVAPVS